ncbi:acyl-CoA dehydrogenase family protein [Amycolatopsis sp. CA-230715]|uniref:acyl-CoA dehydrogenase family protein n=1 Tax=Amycolatopsis sp. CA-230715 TaxID=2745196 RepID=UPI001C0350FF|nr:acyl-CoA dehydrogenase [Amycolatopsis sp. CA-230715]
MDFDLAPEQQKRVDALRTAVRTGLPGAVRSSPDAHFSRTEWAAAAALGLTGLCLPSAFGGGGLGALDVALCLEAFGDECADTGLVFGVAAHLLACVVPIRDFASGSLLDELAPGLADGSVIAANAMTEPEAGSDVGALTTTATRADGGYRLDGVKSFASNGPLADVFVTYAVTDPDAAFLGISAFAVPRGVPGLKIGGPVAKTGLWGCPAGRVEFDGCFVPERYRLGEEGQGSGVFQHSMGWERACLFGLYLGVLARQLRQCVDHARTRRQFGRPIGEFQAVSHRIADMRARLEAARLLVHRACWLLDENREHRAAAAVSKMTVSETAIANSLDAVRIFGGAGYLGGDSAGTQLRDCVPTAIFSGTTDMQKEILTREMGL